MNTSVKLVDLTEEYDGLLEVWQQCFPDDAAFAPLFLKKAALHVQCVAAFVEGKLVSAAYFLPAELSIEGRKWRAQYVYGVGTLPAYRGRGYAAQVLNGACELVKADVFYLHPADAALHSFYEKLGYCDFLYHDTIIPQQESVECTPLSFSISPFCAELYCAVRKRYLSSSTVAYADFPAPLLQTLLQHFSVLKFEGGAALFFENDTTVFLPEILCDEKTTADLVCALQTEYASKKIVATVPGTNAANGMLLTLSDDAKVLLQRDGQLQFFGTMFDI